MVQGNVGRRPSGRTFSKGEVCSFFVEMEVFMTHAMEQLLKSNAYPGRGIVLGITPDGKKAVAAYFIMGRSVNSRNRVFIQEPDGIRTQAYDPALMHCLICFRKTPNMHGHSILILCVNRSRRQVSIFPYLITIQQM